MPPTATTPTPGAAGYDILDSNGTQNPSGIQFKLRITSEVFAFAPAIEYSWKPNLGVLVGPQNDPAAHKKACLDHPGDSDQLRPLIFAQ